MSTVKKPVVCFLGPVASYTHQVHVFDTTQSGRATYGVVPFENSTNGSVVFTLDHFADRQGLYPDLSVCAEIYLDVHHCLLGRSPPEDDEDDAGAAGPERGKSSQQGEESPVSATVASQQQPKLMSSNTFGPSAAPPAGNFLSATGVNAETALTGQRTPTPSDPAPQDPRSRPLVPLTRIERIYSHPQAFGQCNRFLSAYLKGIETVDVSSTSRAAELVRDDATGTSAAISSAAAARLLERDGVDVLAYNIEDREDNTTRFFVLRAGTDDSTTPGPDGDSAAAAAGGPSSSSSLSSTLEKKKKLPGTKSLLSFTVPHAAPGALADVLSCFRAAGLNLTSIASRPSLLAPFQYVFFVEFEGHRSVDPEGKVARVLEQVGRVAESARWLGSWVNQRC
ncbi:Prephenate dehydratase-domain-containing protein [Apiospora aurea]|uniref:Prephenate dehydratase-domain-containing protein n=1 Tax=Apiospora aurea TaxID=335848 RepID=A0ABR1QF38_9PEZI